MITLSEKIQAHTVDVAVLRGSIEFVRISADSYGYKNGAPLGDIMRLLDKEAERILDSALELEELYEFPEQLRA